MRLERERVAALKLQAEEEERRLRKERERPKVAVGPGTPHEIGMFGDEPSIRVTITAQDICTGVDAARQRSYLRCWPPMLQKVGANISADGPPWDGSRTRYLSVRPPTRLKAIANV